jgi:hypothetical protein
VRAQRFRDSERAVNWCKVYSACGGDKERVGLCVLGFRDSEPNKNSISLGKACTGRAGGPEKRARTGPERRRGDPTTRARTGPERRSGGPDNQSTHRPRATL